ncbi:unnamed protein product [Parnassius apollo]|uniref:(apollo) hypothetical protein n=1 Tax=Parnassius apollo TaxID=110799 RepID=A0A8S3XT70_PARAO|nr:unnamed protein product [Parnassius apollo]
MNDPYNVTKNLPTLYSERRKGDYGESVGDIGISSPTKQVTGNQQYRLELRYIATELPRFVCAPNNLKKHFETCEELNHQEFVFTSVLGLEQFTRLCLESTVGL